MSALERAAHLYENPYRSVLSHVLLGVWYTNFVIYAFLKRIFDIILSVVGLILASPLFILFSILIKKEDGGPVFFRQERTGYRGVPFMLYKFRSMPVDNDVLDNTKADKHTKVGKFIRKTSLDELPQLINVLKGDMSFIGPRPWIPEYFMCMNSRERLRVMVKPGITGLAQANGRNGISITKKINYDLEYVKKYSIVMDIRVIFETVAAVISEKGADAGKAAIHNELDELKAKNMRFVDFYGGEVYGR